MTSGDKAGKEAANFVLRATDLATGRSEFRSRPTILEFAFTTACNLKCVMCHQSQDPEVVNAPEKDAAVFLDEVLPTVTCWTPTATSETFTNRMDQLLGLAEKHGAFLHAYTNAVLLTAEALEQLEPRLHRLTISIDSHIPEVLERIRPPADWETVSTHSEAAVAFCTERGIPVMFHLVLLAENLDHLDGYLDWVHGIGGRQVTVLQCLDNVPEYAHLDPVAIHGQDAVDAALAAMRRRATETGIDLTLEISGDAGGHIPGEVPPPRIQDAVVMETFQAELAVEYAGFCPQVMEYLKVEPDGTAYPCCRAPEELKLGNVYERGLEGVWNGPELIELRRRMHARDYPAPCVGCSVLEAPMREAAEKDRDA